MIGFVFYFIRAALGDIGGLVHALLAAFVETMVFKMGLRLIGMGIVAGLLVSGVMIRLLSSQIWGISPYDPVALGLAVATLVLVGLAACYFPARRAMKVDPVVALNS